MLARLTIRSTTRLMVLCLGLKAACTTCYPDRLANGLGLGQGWVTGTSCWIEVRVGLPSTGTLIAPPILFGFRISVAHLKNISCYMDIKRDDIRGTQP